MNKLKNKLPYYSQTIEQILSEFKTRKDGLNDKEVKNLREIFGKNEIKIKNPIPFWKRFIEPFTDPLTILLALAAIVSLMVGETETGIIFFIIIALNAGLEFWQRHQAENIMDSLQNFLKETAKVRRNGKFREILSTELVPGDIVILDEGDAVPADIRLIKTRRLQVNAFALTGESVPQQKSEFAISGNFAPADQTNMVHMGSNIVTGSGEGVVVGTGMNTIFGHISGLSMEQDQDQTPLQKELGKMAKKNFLIAIVIMIAMIFAGIFVLDKSWSATIIFAIVVATSMVPQGLPLEVNLSLLLGVFRLGKKKAIVKKLSAVESLGSASLICTDKTGTLTRNEMNVEYVFGENFEMEIKGEGYLPTAKIFLKTKSKEKQVFDNGINSNLFAKFREFFNALYFNNHARLAEPDSKHDNYYVIGDPTEGALRVLGKRVGLKVENFFAEYAEEDEIPFDSDRKMMSTLFVRKNDNKVVVFTKGATESVLENCTHLKDLTTGEIRELTKDKSREILQKTAKLAQNAYRVLAIATKEISRKKEYKGEEVESKLVFLGCVAMMDLPRQGVQQAFQVSTQAGIKTIMITGDNELTAIAIAKKVKLIPEDEKGVFKITGANLAKISDKKLVQEIQKAKAGVFSRVSPLQKLRIVKLMKKAGEIVAVTGDGVNDAPALRQAHIGVSMGKIGTSVAKESAQIVLADDSYSTLISAIKEGRTIYQNLIKTVKSCYTSNFGELSVVLLGIFFAGKLAGAEPLTPVQILLIDLLGELGPLIALTFDPLFKDSMKKPPRNTRRSVLNKIALVDIIGTGLFMGGAAFVVFVITLMLTNDSVMASTATYIMLILVQYLNMLTRRHPDFIFSKYLFTNKYLWWAMGITFAIILGLIYSPIGAMKAVSFKPLSAKIWLYIMGILTIVLVGLEIKKKFINKWTISEYGEL